MASIYPAKFRALDSNADPVSGAGLWVFEGGTSTPADIFTDAALTTPAANPLEADANGYFAQFFIASGSTVDLECRQDKDSISSTLLWSLESIDSLGAEDASTFERDFGANGRVQFRGSSGKVRLEAGNATGDDIGGSLVISGWDGTDADDITLQADNASMSGNAAIAGDLTVTGDGPFDKILASGTQAAAASHEIALPSGYDTYVMEISQLVASTTLTLSAVFSFDNAATYKTGADDYAWGWWGVGPSTTPSSAVDASDALIGISNLGASSSGAPNGARMVIDSATGRETGLRTVQLAYENGAYGFILVQGMGQTRAKGYGKATNIKLQTSTGTVAFKYVLKGIPNL